jgi:hypothetical protein
MLFSCYVAMKHSLLHVAKWLFKFNRPFACLYLMDLHKTIKIVWHDYLKSSIMLMLSVRLCGDVVSTYVIINH